MWRKQCFARTIWFGTLLLFTACELFETSEPMEANVGDDYPEVAPDIRFEPEQVDFDASSLKYNRDGEALDIEWAQLEGGYITETRYDCYVEGEPVTSDVLPMTRQEVHFLVAERCDLVDTLNARDGRPGMSQRLELTVTPSSEPAINLRDRQSFTIVISSESTYPDPPTTGSKAVHVNELNTSDALFWRETNVIAHDRYGNIIDDIEGEVTLNHLSVQQGRSSYCGDLDFSVTLDLNGTSSDAVPVALTGDVDVEVDVPCAPSTPSFTCDARDTEIGQCVEYVGSSSALKPIKEECFFKASDGRNCEPKTPCCKHTSSKTGLTSYTYGENKMGRSCASTMGTSC